MKSFLTRSFGVKRWSAGAIALGAALFAHGSAHADPPKAAVKSASAEVKVVHATKCEKKSIDPALGDNPPQLGFDCLKVLSTASVPLELNKPSTTPLPNGRTFQLLHSAMVGPRYKVTASISPADGGSGFTKLADVTTEANKAFHVGGFAYQGGMLVLVVRVLPQ